MPARLPPRTLAAVLSLVVCSLSAADDASRETAASVGMDIQAVPELAERLEAVAATLSSGEVTATASGVSIRGVTEREADWQQAMAELEAVAPDDLPVRTSVLPIDTQKPVALICREVFVASTREPIRFQLAGDTLRSASYAALHRLVEFAADCPDARITIVGHSDSVGDPAFNLDLSRRRAGAVARFLTDRGVAADRLEVRGAGASEPVADNATSYGRRQNRRIEFRLTIPD
ncbi:MAG: OmpA family protein [Pseudomonadota bacterium]